MALEPGISVYFHDNRIYIRKKTIDILMNPKYVHLYINSKKKLLFIKNCEKDKNSFKIHYKEYYNQKIKDMELYPLRFYIISKSFIKYIAELIGVSTSSKSLRFFGDLVEDNNGNNKIVGIDLKKYELINYKRSEYLNEDLNIKGENIE